MKGDWRRDRIGSALAAENPMVLAKMKVGCGSGSPVGIVPWACICGETGDSAQPRCAAFGSTTDGDGFRNCG